MINKSCNYIVYFNITWIDTFANHIGANLYIMLRFKSFPRFHSTKLSYNQLLCPTSINYFLNEECDLITH